MRWRLFILAFSIFLSAATAFAAEAPLKVENIRFGLTGEGTRIVFDLSGKTDFRVFMLDNPYRIVVDLPPVVWKTYKARMALDNIVKSYRSGVLDSGLTRVIFDIKKPVIIDEVFTLPRDSFNKNRLVIDVKLASVNLFNARKEEISGNKNLSPKGNTKPAASGNDYAAAENNAARAVAPPVPLPVRKPADSLYTVVVDAGHGGEDPGATGDGVKEKNITLAVAKELKRQLEETGRYRVVLTRDHDFYVKLYDRLDISRRVKADLFISIHADKIERKGVRGASIYTLSEHASDTETARLAEGENNAGFVAGVDLSHETQDVANILLDLAMRDKMNESNIFARMLAYSFLRKGVRLLPNSHRSAGFAVLKAPDVPSVLIEMGFISNPEEAKLLSSGQFQSNIAASITDGVDEYFRKIKSLHKL